MEMDLKLVSKAARNVRFCGKWMNVHNMVENSFVAKCEVQYLDTATFIQFHQLHDLIWDCNIRLKE